ncbi:MAG: AI-2E family transporter [Myxococcota bacterium]|nr:AI-2E family transporter [Myxococcota bacterium]
MSADENERPALRPAHARIFRALLAVLVIGSAWILWPYLPWLVLAGWTAALATPLVDRVAPRRDRRRTAAAIVTLVLVLLLALPTIGVAAMLLAETRVLLAELRATGTGQRALSALVSDVPVASASEAIDATPTAALQWLRIGGLRAWTFASDVVTAAWNVALGLVVFVAGTFVGLAQGRRAFAWGLAHVPLARRDARRFAAAFVETGRGLLIGIGLTGVAQAALAGAAYAVIGVDRAFALAFVTFFASFVPIVGTGVVWLPVAIGLWITGRQGEAIGLLLWSLLVVSTVDNVLRPVLARFGRIDMHVLLLLVSMVGGLVVLGGWGLLLGPLVVRLTIEAMRLAAPSGRAKTADAS